MATTKKEKKVAEVVVEKAPCADCNATGLKDSDNLCSSCEGHG